MRAAGATAESRNQHSEETKRADDSVLKAVQRKSASKKARILAQQTSKLTNIYATANH